MLMLSPYPQFLEMSSGLATYRFRGKLSSGKHWEAKTWTFLGHLLSKADLHLVAFMQLVISRALGVGHVMFIRSNSLHCNISKDKLSDKAQR